MRSIFLGLEVSNLRVRNLVFHEATIMNSLDLLILTAELRSTAVLMTGVVSPVSIVSLMTQLPSIKTMSAGISKF